MPPPLAVIVGISGTVNTLYPLSANIVYNLFNVVVLPEQGPPVMHIL